MVREPPNERRNFIHKRLIGAVTGFARGGFTGAAGGFLTGGGSRVRVPLQPQTGVQVSTPPLTAGGRLRTRRGLRVGSSFFLGAEREQAAGITTGGRVSTRGARAATAALPRTTAGSLLPGGDIDCPADQCCKGFRKNKSTYHLRNGTLVLKGTKCVKIRRRDALNGSAALHSTSRLTSYVKANKNIDNAIKAAARKV